MQNIVFLRSNISAINDQEIHIQGARVHNLKNVEKVLEDASAKPKIYTKKLEKAVENLKLEF